MKKMSKSLAALTHAALAIPTLAGAAELQTDYLYGHYAEDDLAGSKLAGGSRHRFDIDSHLFRIVAPWNGQVLGLDLTVETMSGASPWYVQPDAQGRPVQVMSGASIREDRQALKGTWATELPFMENVTTAFNAGYSTEDDYEAISGGVELEYTGDAKIVTWSGGVEYSSDRVEPVQKTGIARITHDDRDSVSLYGGASVVLDALTVAQLSANVQRASGYLSDPYKQAWIVSASNTVPDTRPDERESIALSAKLRHHFPSLDASVHVDYRYFHDDWDIDAHTVNLAWEQSVGNGFRIAPSVRWYSQSQAGFYAPWYEQRRDDGLATSDYRLSPFGALSARIELTKSLGDALDLGAGVEAYKASDAFALKDVDTVNPGLVRYASIQARLVYRFK